MIGFQALEQSFGTNKKTGCLAGWLECGAFSLLEQSPAAIPNETALFIHHLDQFAILKGFALPRTGVDTYANRV
jgi:hypothetical protein